MVSVEEKKRRAEEKERKEKEDANYKFWIAILVALIPSGIAVLALYQSYGLPDKLHNIEQQMHQLDERTSKHVLEIENVEKRFDSVQMARIDTLGK